MDFVTKKEFESAVSIIERALKNGQLEIISTKETFEALYVSYAGYADLAVPINHANFVPMDLAAKNQLHTLRNTLRVQREDADKNKKVLEKLEAEEQRLLALLPTLKE